MNAPIANEEAQIFIDTLNAYNKAVEELNTCYGGHTTNISHFNMDDENMESLDKNAEFTILRAEQTDKVIDLGNQVRETIARGYADEYRKHQTAMYEWLKANPQ